MIINVLKMLHGTRHVLISYMWEKVWPGVTMSPIRPSNSGFLLLLNIFLNNIMYICDSYFCFLFLIFKQLRLEFYKSHFCNILYIGAETSLSCLHYFSGFRICENLV